MSADFVIAIGRGSGGTRLLSEVLQRSGVYMGTHPRTLNISGDLIPPDKMYAAVKLAGKLVKRIGHQEWDFSALLASDPPADFIRLVSEYLRPITSSGRPLKGFKLPETLLALPWIVKLFPEAHYIYWTRDPRTAVITPHITDDLRYFNVPCTEVRGKLSVIDRRLESWLYQWRIVEATPEPACFLRMRYEDFVTDQEGELSRLSKFLGFEAKPTHVDRRRVDAPLDDVDEWFVQLYSKDIADGMTFFAAKGLVPRKRLRIVIRGPGAIIPATQDSWDLCEVFWDPQEHQAVIDGKIESRAQYIVLDCDRSIRKLGLIKKLLTASDFWKAYDVIMLADDDMDPIGCTVESIFDLFDKTGVRIAQPALTNDSHFSHDITRQVPDCEWREVSFVEMGIPIFTRAALEEYLPYFSETVTGWGIDVFWSLKEVDAGRHLAILDATPVRHSRAVGGGAYYKGLRVAPYDEMRAFLEREKIWSRVQPHVKDVFASHKKEEKRA